MNDFFTYWLFRIKSALRWYWHASTRFDVHSPLLNEFMREVYLDDRHYHAFDRIRQLRKFWSSKSGRVKLLSLGAPSRTTFGKERSVSGLVSDNAINDRSGRFLFRLALWLQPDRIVEFGTNAGISAVYLHSANTTTPLHTVEGNPQVAALARESFALANTSEALQPHVGLFDDWLRRAVSQPPQKLLFFLDGDHRYQPTLDYVNELRKQATAESIFVIADIHWSEGMERAWEKLKKLPGVTASVDTYHFGLLFFRPEMSGPHIGLIQTRWKPWRVGFFS